jgi:hypothetical protein
MEKNLYMNYYMSFLNMNYFNIFLNIKYFETLAEMPKTKH